MPEPHRRRLPRRPAGPLLAALLAGAALLMSPTARPASAAGECAEEDAGCTMVTQATYVVEPGEGWIDVSVAVTFTNATPDPAGRISVFTEVPLAIHDGASQVAARDARGALGVEVGSEGDVNVATVDLRSDLRYEQRATFTLTYRLADGAQPGVRVRPSLVVFPAWAFGSTGSVRIEVPSGYDIRTDGAELIASVEPTSAVLTSGEIGATTEWVALVIAARGTSFVTHRESVPLSGGTVDLQVRSWADDRAWGERVERLLASALPLLEEAAGFPYTGVGPLVVVEVAALQTGDVGEGSVAGQQIEIGFEATDFVVLHQAAHVWAGSQLFADRWLREGLASHLAAGVADQLEVAPPFDPEARRTELAEDSFPLAQWEAGESDPDREAFGYAASWALIEAVVDQIGQERLRAALARAAAGLGAYETAPVADRPTVAPDAPAVDSRRFLDQAEQVSGVDLADLFAAEVFAPRDAGLIAARALARSAYAELLEAATDWGAPIPVREAMAAWDFDAAADQIATARSWLAERDALRAAISDAGLSTPARLRQRYEQSGGGPEAWSELEAERAVVDDYRRVAGEVATDRSPLQRLGLLGEREPGSLLAIAAGEFADGDLTAAHAAIRQAGQMMEAAEGGGLARLISSIALIAAVGTGIFLFARQRRRYTPRP